MSGLVVRVTTWSTGGSRFLGSFRTLYGVEGGGGGHRFVRSVYDGSVKGLPLTGVSLGYTSGSLT